MSDKPVTAQEALLTELLGDVGRLHDVIKKIEGGDLSKAINEMKLLNDLVAKTQREILSGYKSDRESVKQQMQAELAALKQIRISLDGFDLSSIGSDNQSNCNGFLIAIGCFVSTVCGAFFVLAVLKYGLVF